jgi:hypothetical protein
MNNERNPFNKYAPYNNVIAIQNGDNLNTAIAAAVSAGVAVANPITIVVGAGAYTAPVGGFDFTGVKGLTIRGAGVDATAIYPNAADVYSDKFVFNLASDTEKCDFYDFHVDLTCGGTTAVHYGGCVDHNGTFNTFHNCKFSWNFGYGTIGGPHEGGYENCGFVALSQYDTNDVCISAGDETWTAGTDVTFSNDTADKVHYDSSAVFTVGGSGIANNATIGTIVPSYGFAENAPGQTQTLWIKVNWSASAGAIRIKTGTATGAGNTGNIMTVTMPALTANKWTRIQYNHPWSWGSTIAEVKIEAGGNIAAGSTIKINDFWMERLRYKTNKLYAFGGNTQFMHVTNCWFAIRQYIASPAVQHKTLIGIADIGSSNTYFKHPETNSPNGSLYSESSPAACNLTINGGRIHHTIKRYGHCEPFSAHDNTTLLMGNIPILIWSDMSPDPDASEGTTVNGTEHTLRVLCTRHAAIVAATMPTLAIRDYGVLQLDANTHTIDHASSKVLSINGTALVYNTADLPAAALAPGVVISDKEAGKLKVSDGANWIVQV